MTRNPLKLFFATVLCLGALATPALAQINISIDLGSAPPPPRYEVMPESRPGWFWVPGFWYWEGHRHHWSKGHWERVRPGYQWVPARWEERGDRHHYEPARWEPEHRERDRRDNDRDHGRDDDDRGRGNGHDNGHGKAWGRRDHDGR